MKPTFIDWFILLWDDDIHVLPRAATFRERGRAERAQQRTPGSRILHRQTRGP